MLSSELEFCLNEAFQRARERRHEFMTVEHLLLALLDNPTAAKVLRACGADLNALRRQLTEHGPDFGAAVASAGPPPCPPDPLSWSG